MNEKLAAYRKVRSAIETGELVRPERCSKCGASDIPCSDGRSRIQAHHHDYSKPLDVEWICCKCHREETPLPEVMGGKCFGDVNGQAKLNPELVLMARSLRDKGMAYQAIANKIGVHKTTVMRAVKGTHWPHVGQLAAAPKGGE